jgi:hypothetical protein
MGWLGRAVAEPDQDTTHSNHRAAETNPYALQRAEPAPPASADKVHCYDTEDDEPAESHGGKSELSFSDHNAHIIAQGGKGATLRRGMRIGR